MRQWERNQRTNLDGYGLQMDQRDRLRKIVEDARRVVRLQRALAAVEGSSRRSLTHETLVGGIRTWSPMRVDSW